MIAIIPEHCGSDQRKNEVKREIETLLAAKKYEYKVMSIIPYAIIDLYAAEFSRSLCLTCMEIY